MQSYLDVLAPDGTSRGQLDEALAAFARNLAALQSPSAFVLGEVTIRFGVELRRERLRAQDLEMLRSVAWTLLDEGAHRGS